MKATITTPPPGLDDQNELTWPRRRGWPVLAMVGVGAALLVFTAYSQTVTIRYGFFAHPPIYGIFELVVDPLGLWAIPTGLVLAAIAWFATSSQHVPTWLAVVLIIGGALATAAAIAVVRGDAYDLVRGVSTAPRVPSYTTDLHFVYEYGVRGFVERYPDLITQFYTYNAKTHPPGVLVFLYLLFEVFGASHPLLITTALAAIGLSAGVAAWSMGRTIGGERAGRIAAIIFVAAPGPLMLAYTNMDVIFATLMSASAALFMIAINKGSPAIAAVAGAVLAICTMMTYATAFLALAATITVAVQSSSLRSALRLLGAAAAGGLGVLLLARLSLGFDLLGAYDVTPRSTTPYNPYWIFAHPLALLIWAGLPLAALGVAGLVIKVPGARRPVLPLVLVGVMLVWGVLPAVITGLRYGEVERTWAFLYPMLAAAAGPVVDRWTRGMGRWSGPVIALLVVASVAQTALLQALWDNLQ